MQDGYAPTSKEIPILLTIYKLYEQQQYMYQNKIHSVDNHIGSIIQQWIQPIRKRQTIRLGEWFDVYEIQLDYRFYRCHRSYIVNTDNIKEVNFQKLTIYMENGEICPISVRAKTSFKKYYNEHLISIGNTVTRISKKCNNE